LRDRNPDGSKNRQRQSAKANSVCHEHPPSLIGGGRRGRNCSSTRRRDETDGDGREPAHTIICRMFHDILPTSGCCEIAKLAAMQ